MAQIKIKCPNKDCGKTLIVDSDMAGKKGKCSTCDAVFLIPGTPSPETKPGGSTVHLATTKSGELSDETKKGPTSNTKKAPKSGPAPASSKKSSEKFLDDYVEKSPPKKPRASREDLDDYAVEEVDYVDHADEDDRPRKSRPERRPQSRRDEDYEDYEDYDDRPRGRRRRDDDYEEDYYEEDEGYGQTVRKGGGRSRKKSGPNIGLIRAGMLTMAIAGCVFSGALGIKMLVELIGILSFPNVGETSGTIWKIAEVIWMGAAIAVIVGYSFLLFFPNKNSSMGLTIAALVIGSINLIVQIVFKIIPLFSDGQGFLGIDLLGFGGDSKAEFFIKIGLIEGLFIAEMVLVAIAFMAINKQLKDRYNVQSAKRMIIPAGIYGGILIVIGMFILILSESKINSQTAFTIWKWVLYLCRVGSQGMLIWYFVSYILLMFNSRNVLSKS